MNERLSFAEEKGKGEGPFDLCCVYLLAQTNSACFVLFRASSLCKREETQGNSSSHEQKLRCNTHSQENSESERKTFQDSIKCLDNSECWSISLGFLIYSVC